MQRCGIIYVAGGSMILPYRDKGNLLINGRHRKDYGGAPWAPPRLRWGGAATTSVKVMEMHVGPRPVKGGPGRTGVKTRPLTTPHGGSRGPVDPWSASTASKRRDLWFFLSRKNTEIVALATTVFRPKPLYCISAVKKAQNLAPGAPGAGPPQSTTQPRRRRVGT